MTIRNLFNIILKIIGLFFIKNILFTGMQLGIYILQTIRLSNYDDELWILLSAAGTLLIYGAISYFLIFRSEYIIDKMKLDKGFDEEIIPFNMHWSTILSIAIIIIGGLIVVDTVPDLCLSVFNYWQMKNSSLFPLKENINYMVTEAAKIVVGIMIMSNQRLIVKYIERKRQK